MLPSIGEKLAVAVVGWVSGCAFAFDAWALVVEFGPGFDGSVFADAYTARHLLTPSFASIVATSELLAVRLVGKTSWLF